MSRPFTAEGTTARPNVNKRITIDRGDVANSQFRLFFEGVTVEYALELEKEEIEAILLGEHRLREILGDQFVGTLANKLMEPHRFITGYKGLPAAKSMGVRKVVYGGEHKHFIYLTLSVHYMKPENYYRITKTIADHIDYCRAASLLLPEGEPA